MAFVVEFSFLFLCCVMLHGAEKHSANSIYAVRSELLNNGGLLASQGAYRSQGGFENQLQGSISGSGYEAGSGLIRVVSLLNSLNLEVGSQNGVLLASLSPQGNGIVFEMHSANNHLYTIQYQDNSPDPNGTWTELSANHEGDGNLLMFEDDSALGLEKRFYRIVIEAYNQQYISDPFGFYCLEIESGPNMLSLPLMGMPAYQGSVSAVGDGSIEVSTIPDLEDGLLAIQNGFHQYIVLLREDQSESPGNQGDWWGIADNAGNTLTLGDRGEDLLTLLEEGDVVEIRQLISFKDMFGFGDTLVLNADSNGFPNKEEEDLFRIVQGSSFAEEIFYHDGTLVDEGYYINGAGPLDGSTLRLLPNQTLMMFRKTGATTLTPRVVGQAQIASLTAYLETGPNTFGTIFSDSIEIHTSGLLDSGWKQDSNGFPNRLEEDLLRPVVGLGYGQEIFYHDGSLAGVDPGWYVDGLLNGAYPIEPLHGYVLFIQSGPRKWRQTPPY